VVTANGVEAANVKLRKVLTLVSDRKRWGSRVRCLEVDEPVV